MTYDDRDHGLDFASLYMKATFENACLTVDCENLRKQNKKLRDALKPFADELNNWQNNIDDSVWVDNAFCIGNLRAADEALKESNNG